ncbi:PPIP5K2 isoform 11, partial [Pan troglodytes]
GCEEDKNLPSGYGYRPASRENEGRRPFKIDNDDEPHTSKRDEVDRAVILFKPMVSEPIHIHRKSPLPRSRKMATNDVVSENANYLRTPRTLVEQKQNPTVGSHCAGLFSTSVLGGSSSAPNLQDYARTHRKKLTSSGCIDDATRGSAVKRFSISFARHPTNGFELYSMVPSICPLETLHNALSLKQVDEFLASIASPSSDVPRKTAEISSTALRSSPIMRKKVSLNTYTPAKILPTPPATLKSTKASSKPATSG